MSLTDKQLEAAKLVAKGKHTIPDIAQMVGVSPRTLNNWKAEKDFNAEVSKVRNAWREKAKATGIGDPDRRLFRKNDRWRRLQHIIEERAKDPELENVPGAKSGLIVITEYKPETYFEEDDEGKRQKLTRQVPIYKVDTAMLAEMRAIEQDAAIECGQWKAKPVEAEPEEKEADATVVALATLLTAQQRQEIREKLLAMQAALKASQNEPDHQPQETATT